MHLTNLYQFINSIYFILLIILAFYINIINIIVIIPRRDESLAK
jgi:hypothetical protein